MKDSQRIIKNLKNDLARNRKSSFERYLAGGGDPNIVIHEGNKLITVAVDNEKPWAIELLGKHGADLDTIDDSGFTPLTRAVQQMFETTVEALLKAGANPTINDRSGTPPLEEAIAKNDLAIIKILVKHIRLRPDDEQTGILWGLTDSEAAFKTLIIAGADVEKVDENGWNAMHFAVAAGYESALKLLVNKKNLDINCRDLNGGTPLMMAAGEGLPNMCRLLLKLGADITLLNNDGQAAHMMTGKHVKDIDVGLNQETFDVLIDARKKRLETNMTPGPKKTGAKPHKTKL